MLQSDDFEKKLTELIGFKTTENQPKQNRLALDWLIDKLAALHFHCEIHGQDLTHQPLLVARFAGINSDKKMVIYNHYDVAEVKPNDVWYCNDPFAPTVNDGRVYARGIADNKGPLVARLQALSQLIHNDRTVPQILWLIQGEEEVVRKPRVAIDLMKPLIDDFAAKVYIEETGFNDIDKHQALTFLWSPTVPEHQLTSWHQLLNDSLGKQQIVYRHLNKLNGVKQCPLLLNLPDDSVYIGFGPNDKHHRIHLSNESLDYQRLIAYPSQFALFVENYASQ